MYEPPIDRRRRSKMMENILTCITILSLLISLHIISKANSYFRTITQEIEELKYAIGEERQNRLQSDNDMRRALHEMRSIINKAYASRSEYFYTEEIQINPEM